MEFSHCCHADFRGSAAALPWKVQGFGQFRPKTLRRNKVNQPCKPWLSRLAALFRTHSNKTLRSGIEVVITALIKIVVAIR